MGNTPVLLGILSNLENNLVGNLDDTNSLDATITIPQVIGEQYVLPPATRETLGGIIVGENLLVTEEGVLSTGEMINNGSTSGSFDGLTTMSYSIPAGYTSGGTVTLTSAIEDALSAI